MTPKEIITIRLKRGYNKTEFGALIGVTAETITNWETGKFKPSKCWHDKIRNAPRKPVVLRVIKK